MRRGSRNVSTDFDVPHYVIKGSRITMKSLELSDKSRRASGLILGRRVSSKQVSLWISSRTPCYEVQHGYQPSYVKHPLRIEENIQPLARASLDMDFSSNRDQDGTREKGEYGGCIAEWCDKGLE